MAITTGMTIMSTRQAALFISHGAPTLPLEDSPTRHFLTRLGETLPRPRAIVVVSAHWETTMPTVNLAARDHVRLWWLSCSALHAALSGQH
jgi:aromatic ring-opening dioxygenase catalytic subunit (LigB family)